MFVDTPTGHRNCSLLVTSANVLLCTLLYPWTGGSSSSSIRYLVRRPLKSASLLIVFSQLGNRFQVHGPNTANDASYRERFLWLQFLGKRGKMAWIPNLPSGRNDILRSFGKTPCRICHIISSTYRSRRRCKDISPSLFSRSQ